MKKYFILILFIFVFVMSGCVKYKDPTTSTKPQTSTTPPSVATSDSTTNKHTTTTTISTPNDNRLEYDVFSNILKEFDSANNLTIKEENLTDEILSRNIKISNGNYAIRNTYDDDIFSWIYYDNDMHKYYYEDGVWKRIVLEEDDLDYKLDLNLKRYINAYNTFEYNHNESLYSLTQYIDSNTYSNIQIKIQNNKIISYRFTVNQAEYLYTFTDYDVTNVTLPQEYNDVHEKLDNDGWDELLTLTATVTNFSSTNIFEDKIGEEEYYVSASINRYNNNEYLQTITTSNGLFKYYYKIKGSSKETYKKENNSWILDKTEAISATAFSQMDSLPIQLLQANYDLIMYNDIADSYSLKNFEYAGNKYSDIIIVLENNLISYISIKYTYTLNKETHNVTQIIEFSSIGNTTIDEVIE